MGLKNIIQRGSVKNIWEFNSEDCVFEFSDRYSIFDWGEMPDRIPSKGESLAVMSDCLFKNLGNPEFWNRWMPSTDFLSQWGEEKVWKTICQKGLAHHGKGQVDSEGHYLRKDRFSAFWKVKKVEILKPTLKGESWDYSCFSNRPNNTLVPLEIIYRFGVPKGSSLLSRLDKEYIHKDLELSKVPSEGDKYTYPIIEFSSKLENADRYFTYEEAKKNAGLTESEFFDLKLTATLIALRLKDFFAKQKINLVDGKLEFAYTAEGFMLVDAIGPDEMRLMYKDVHLSKEFLRSYYRTTQWYETLVQCKNKDPINWKKLVKLKHGELPERLSKEYLNIVHMIYATLANTVRIGLGKDHAFPTAWSLEKLIAEMAEVNKYPLNSTFKESEVLL